MWWSKVEEHGIVINIDQNTLTPLRRTASCYNGQPAVTTVTSAHSAVTTEMALP
jgi:hypothetical protein